MLVVLVLLLPILVFPASAVYDYNDLITNIVVDGDKDIVTISVPLDAFTMGLYCHELDDTAISYLGSSFVASFEPFCTYDIQAYGFGREYLDVTNIPDGTTVTFDVSLYTSGASRYSTPSWFTQVYYRNDVGYIGQNVVDHGNEAILENFVFEMTMDKVAGATSAWFILKCQGLEFWDPTILTFAINSMQLTFSISSLYRLQEQTGKTNEILSAVEKKLEENGQKLDDVIDKIEQNGDKLDDTNDKIDKLPGEIGDEIQGVIDNEKQEAESSGNKFVDQILGALPDPSTEVLSALKGLTDATSYTGTDAVLPVPAIVLPGIDGLFPETVIWEGAELDFGEYMNILPPALLSLVRSLFTIAIVLFCVYELKGIISYCLTLRENKGG